MTDITKAMAAVAAMNESHGVTQRGGKKYTEVAKRIEVFRTHFGLDYGLESDVMIDDGNRVVMKATIRNPAGTVIATGFAEEIRGSSNVNKTSAIENCESSAWGRALANLGMHGGQIASIDEIHKAERNNTAIDEKAQWQQWAASCEAHVQTLTSQAALMAWSHENDQNCKTLAGVDQAAHDSLEQAWTAHMEKLKNG
jgi:hypothetical protein|tara:strand:- start:40 stop:633 length:594 start_codon:yes stop_codon:yes gene_type:complete